LATICRNNHFGDGNFVATSIIGTLSEMVPFTHFPNLILAFLVRTGLLHPIGQAEAFVKRMLRWRIGTAELTESQDLTNVLRDNRSVTIEKKQEPCKHSSSQTQNSLTVTLLTAFTKVIENGHLKLVLSEPILQIFHLMGSVDINPQSLLGGEQGGSK